MHSYHIFCFPFKWDVLDAATYDLSTRLSLTNIQPKIGCKWLDMSLCSDTLEERKSLYDEKDYFYKFVHPIMYDTLKEDSLLKHFKREECIHNPDNCEYRIVVRQGNSFKEYVLHIDAMNLNFYSTGVGMLSFYLINNSYEKFEDVLNINQYGRRVFPPFYDDIESRIQTAESITITGLQGIESRYREDFTNYKVEEDWKTAGFITNLIADFQDNLEIIPVIDDRMIVNCWYQDQKIGNRIKTKDEFIYSTDWYRYVFVDKGNDGPTCANDEMRHDLLDNTTYVRWQQEGSIYGASKYSFMLATDRCWYAENILSVNMRTIYSRMLELVIMQRATILKFSEEVTHLSVIKPQFVEQLSARIGSLYKEYIRFINKMFFRDITAQDQGVDLYKLMMSQFQCEERIKELDEEINELHAYISLLMDQQRNKNAAWFSLLAAIFLPATILVGMFGMNSFGEEFIARHFIIQCLIGVAITVITLIIIFKKKLWVK